MEENNNKILRRSNKVKLLASCAIIRNIFFNIIFILIIQKYHLYLNISINVVASGITYLIRCIFYCHIKNNNIFLKKTPTTSFSIEFKFANCMYNYDYLL